MRRVLVLMSLMAMVWVVAPAAHAAPFEQFKFEGATATAGWFDADEEGGTFANAFLNEGTFTFGGDSFDFASFDFVLSEFDEDGFTDIFGSVELAPGDYTLDAEGGRFSASVDTSLELVGQECEFTGPFPDCTALGPFFVDVSVVWDEAGGRIYPTRFSGRSSGPGFLDIFQQRTLARATVATGDVSGDLSIDLGESDDASIGRDSFMDRFRFSG